MPGPRPPEGARRLGLLDDLARPEPLGVRVSGDGARRLHRRSGDRRGEPDGAGLYARRADADRHPARKGAPPQGRRAIGGARPRPRLVRLLQRRAGPARDSGRSRVRGQSLHLRIRYQDKGRRHLRQQGVPLRHGRGRCRVVERGGALRQHPHRHERRARGRRPALRQRRLPVRQRGRRILRLRQGQWLQLEQQRFTRPPRSAREDPADHSRRGSGARQSIRRERGAVQLGRANDGRQSVPGNLCLRAAQPLPFRL